jgi:hypothetical protein
MRRACRPICASPISPSISAFGTSAGHRVHDHDVHAVGPHQHFDDFERLFAVVGCDTSRLSSSTPSFCA